MIRQPTIQASNFDSVLHPVRNGKPATLTIRMKVRLIARDPAVTPEQRGFVRAEHLARGPKDDMHLGNVVDYNGTPFPSRSWQQDEFNAFSKRFKKVVETAWNNQLILLPPDVDPQYGGLSDAAYRDFINAPNVAAHVRCGLDIQLLDRGVASTPHALIEVVRLGTPNGKRFRASFWRVSNDAVDFSVHRDPDDASTHYRQFTAAHEIGHWLGHESDNGFFPHVEAAECAGSRNRQCQYGQKPRTRQAHMGMGSVLTPYEAAPWLHRIVTHSGSLHEWTYAHRVNFEHRVPVSARQLALAGAPPPGAARGPAPAHP